MTSPKSPGAGAANTPPAHHSGPGKPPLSAHKPAISALRCPQADPIPCIQEGNPETPPMAAPTTRNGHPSSPRPLGSDSSWPLSCPPPQPDWGSPRRPRDRHGRVGEGNQEGRMLGRPHWPRSSPGSRGIPPPRSRCSIAPPSPAPNRGGHRTTRSHPLHRRSRAQ